jgi:hypothetical protein
LRIYLLAGRKTSLLWCRDRANTWQSELQEERGPATLRDLTIRGVKPAHRARLYDPWTGRWRDLEPPKPLLRIPELRRSAVVRLEAR